MHVKKVGRQSCPNTTVIFIDLNADVQFPIIALGEGFHSIEWSNGLVSDTLWLDESAVVSAMAVGYQACYANDSVSIEQIAVPKIELLDTVFFCTGDTALLALQMDKGGYLMDWNTGETSDSILISEEGVYSVFVMNDYGCSAEDSSVVLQKQRPEIELPFDSVTFCRNQMPLEIVAEVFPDGGSVDVAWSNGASGTDLQIEYAGVYIVSADLEGCVGFDTLMVSSCPLPQVYVPNVFCPNSGGENATFGVYFDEGVLVSDFHMRVVDRWGGLVFESRDSSVFWDGTVNGSFQAPQGIYTFALHYQEENADYPTSRFGSIFLKL